MQRICTNVKLCFPPPPPILSVFLWGGRECVGSSNPWLSARRGRLAVIPGCLQGVLSLILVIGIGKGGGGGQH
jgi:hypothetical protein